MVAKSQIKLIKSLQQKKYRNQHQLFVAEGRKGVEELLNSGLECTALFTEGKDEVQGSGIAPVTVTSQQLQQMSSLKTPAGVLGVFKIPPVRPWGKQGSVLALDAIRDPGNLGTMIRLCDWFGIEHLICSEDTVDCYNPKVVQATMGSLSRVNIFYTDLQEFLKKDQRTVVVADMHGENVYNATWDKEAILVMGNEANGISPEVMALAQKVVSIPRFGKAQLTESLNVATATAILLSELRRSH